MTARYVAAIDQGTSSTRCIIYDRGGVMVSVAQRKHTQYFPQPGWVEHDALEIWKLVQRLIPEALRNGGIEPDQLVGLGITNQRETTVIWDPTTGVPLHRAIVWQDTRTTDKVEDLRSQGVAADAEHRTGAPLSNYFSAPRLSWMLDACTGSRAAAERGRVLFGTMDSWLVWNLTGGVDGGLHVTDPTNASRTMLMNIETAQWDPTLLDVFDVPAAILPEIRPSMSRVGVTTTPVAGIPITAMIGDQQAALVGQTALRAGESKYTLGTGGFLLFNTGTTLVRSRSGLITTVAFQSDGQPIRYALEGSNPTAGALVEWIRQNLGIIATPAEIETLASTVTDNGGCYIVPAFSGLHAPHWVSGSRGLIVGLTSYITRGHLARAALETNAFAAAAMVTAVNDDLAAAGVDTSLTELVVDGGMTANNTMMQMIADMCDVPVTRPQMAEAVALGAAYAAGLTVGLWTDEQQLRRNWRAAAVWKPDVDPADRERRLANWSAAVRLASQWSPV
ncbi:glycerol kinase GlpK [Williamsia phyllosphaerae]|uniref:ATP:glycerol 3-phosphotransferase n=1 Tax=Williamsia phyllosphaerae TaxID=885042 RepID=A0ABQ1V356_9NOCA|nr:glycerol kinase GlpK [Williamsia phyllosphaerae]GGF34472.1 glycerol kinase [Williamsia phyllosphaerae]